MTRFVQISEIRDPVTDGAADSRTDCPWYLLNTRKNSSNTGARQTWWLPRQWNSYNHNIAVTTTISAFPWYPESDEDGLRKQSVKQRIWWLCDMSMWLCVWVSKQRVVGGMIAQKKDVPCKRNNKPPVVFWSSGHAFLWSSGRVVLWSSGPVPSSVGPLVLWSFQHWSLAYEAGQ